MNIKQVKDKFTLQSLLSTLGHYPDKKKSKGHDLWYCSPLRPGEKEPSFHIDTHHDFYKDFGDAEKGGDLIWFARMYLKSLGKDDTVSSALKWFKDLDGGTQVHVFNKTSHKSAPKPTKKEEAYKVLSDKEIFSTALVTYLERKGLPLPLAKKYMRQIYFFNRKSGKKMFGLGFKTRAGGFDVRLGNGFKTMIGNKDITIIKGTQKTLTLDIFEGASDFLTILAIQQRDEPEFDTIVLNSGNLYEQAAIYIQKKNYAHVRTWLDNDEAGQKFETAFSEKLMDLNVLCSLNQMNHIYKDFKDLNAWHTQSNLDLSSKKNALIDLSKSKHLGDSLDRRHT